jgi:hypothetical protein
MKRVTETLLVLLLIPGFGWAQTSQNNWDNLKRLAPGDDIRIVLNDKKSYKAKFQSVSDEAIVVRLATGDQAIERQSVLRVSTKGASHRTRNALIGAGVGAGVGAAGFGICDYREVIPCGGEGAAIGAVFVAPFGAAAGALVPTGRWHDVYRGR